MSETKRATNDRDSNHPGVILDPTDETTTWRYTCPNGHSDWSPTNNHIICRSCRQLDEHGEHVDSVEHYEILDTKTEEEIPWSAVEIAEPA